MNNQYMSLGSRILTTQLQPDRTGVGTHSEFGCSLRVRGELPMILCKRINTRAVWGELLWMIAGNTNAADLATRPEFGSTKIWMEDARRFHARLSNAGSVGPLGRVYGAQMTDWKGADGVSIDQLTALVALLRQESSSRRGLVTMYNPSETGPYTAALPPCHVLFQAQVNGGEMCLAMYQRSADYLLGLPFNLLSYGTIQAMLAQIFNVPCGVYMHAIGDCHVYANHVGVVREMLLQKCSDSRPRLLIKDRGQSELSHFRIEDFSIADMPDAEVFTGVMN